MKKRKTNPKVQNTLLLIACIVLFLILGSLLFFNHKKEAANSSELKKAAQEEIQKEKSDQTWTENQNSEDQYNTTKNAGIISTRRIVSLFAVVIYVSTFRFYLSQHYSTVPRKGKAPFYSANSPVNSPSMAPVIRTGTNSPASTSWSAVK